MAHHRSVMTNNNNAPDPPRGQSQRAAASSRSAARNSQPTAARRRPGHEGNHVEGARDCVTWQRAQWQRAAGTISKGRGHPPFSSNMYRLRSSPCSSPAAPCTRPYSPPGLGQADEPLRLVCDPPGRQATAHKKAVRRETAGEGSAVGLRRRPSRQLWRGCGGGRSQKRSFRAPSVSRMTATPSVSACSDTHLTPPPAG